MLKPVRNSRRSSGASSPSSALARLYPADPEVAGLGTGSPFPWGSRAISTSTTGFGPARSDNGADVCQWKVEGLGNSGVDHFPFDHVQTEPQCRVGLARRTPALFGELKSVWQRSIGEGQGRRTGHAARHICHGVMQNAVYEVRGVFVGGGSDGLHTTALVYRDVHNHRAGL